MVRARRVGRLGVFGLSLAAVGFAIGGSAFGCGGTDSAPAGADNDAAAASEVGTNPNAEGGGPGAVTIDIQVPAVTVYAGQTAQLVASQSKASNGAVLNFGWAFASVPQGSTVTTLQGVNELVSFMPDIAGDYVITVTATTGAITTKKEVTVKAVNAPIFYVRTTGGTTPEDIGFEVHTVQMDGTGDHAVGCRQRSLSLALFGDAGIKIDDAGPEAGAQLGMMGFIVTALFADQAIDWWEAPAGESSHAAFQNITFGGDAGPDAANNKIALFVGTQENTCQNPPFAARSFMGKDDDAVLQPKFSPDGRRVAFIERRDKKLQVVTSAIDGTDARVLGSYCPSGTNDCTSNGNLLFPRRPQWLDETHLGWMRASDEQSDVSVSWEIVVVADIPSAPVNRYMACTSGAMPTLFNFLRDGTILANVRATRYGAEDLLVLNRGAGGTCTALRNLTHFGSEGSYARDFAISPDGVNVAYLHRQLPAGSSGKPDAGSSDFRQGGDLYMVPLDGSKAPAPIGAVRRAEYGPRWIAGGTRLAWNGSAPPPPGYDAGDLFSKDSGADAGNLFEAGLPAINVIQADGGNFTPVAYGDPSNGSYVLGGGNGGACSLECGGLACKPQSNCSSVEKRGGEGATFWASMFGFAFLLRRRSRKQR